LSYKGATVHDMFNLLSVLILLPIEIAFQLLEKASHFLVGPLYNSNPNVKEPEMLNAITKPLTEAIIQIDKSVLDSIASNKAGFENASLIRRVCKKQNEHNMIVNQSYAFENSSSVYFDKMLAPDTKSSNCNFCRNKLI